MHSNHGKPGANTNVSEHASGVSFLRIGILTVVACCFGFSCSGEGGGTVGTLPDQGGTDVGDVIIPDIGGDLSDSGPLDIGTDEGQDISDGGGQSCSTFAETVQPILMEYCVGCHTVSGLGGHNIAANYDDSQLPASSAHPECDGMNIGECSLALATTGDMPPTPKVVTGEELAILQAWVDAGTPEGPYDCTGEDTGGGTDEGGTDEGGTDEGVTDEGSTDEGGTDEGADITDAVEPACSSYADTVQPVLMEYCSGCHSDFALGGHNIASNYDDALLSASGTHSECADMNIGECALALATTGDMPPSGGEVSAEDLAILQAWVDAGVPEGPYNCTGEDAGGGTDEGGTDSGPSGPITYDDDVQSILMLYCSGCHTLSSLGGHNVASSYDEALLAADGPHLECYGLNIGQCSVALSETGDMPPGSNTVSAEHLAILQQWLTDGMLESAP